MSAAVTTPPVECLKADIQEKKTPHGHVTLVRFAKLALTACLLAVLLIESSSMDGRKDVEKPIMAREPRPDASGVDGLVNVEHSASLGMVRKPPMRPEPAAHHSLGAPGKSGEGARKPLMRSEPKPLKLAMAIPGVNVEVAREPLMRSEPKPLKPAAAVGVDGELIRKPLMRSERTLKVPPVVVGTAAAAIVAPGPDIPEADDIDSVETHREPAAADTKQRRGYFGLLAPIFAAVMLLSAFAFQARELIGQVLNMPLAKDYFGIKKK